MTYGTACPSRSVLITGAAGYIGRQLVAGLASNRGTLATVVAMDVRPLPAEQHQAGLEYCTGDVREAEIEKVFRDHAIDTVVHLAAIVTPGKHTSPELEYSVDVLGTQNILRICAATGVSKLIVTSSGAAYGYHADNPAWLRESDALRGNDTFPYARHKRLVEEMLARFRDQHPALRQLIFRPGTILGELVSNQITDIFERPLILGVRGAPTPFVFIWDQDVVACLMEGIHNERGGIYNLAGDGVLTLQEIAARTGKRYVALPAGLIRAALGILHPLKLSQYGPDQVDFLRYRPVLSNEKLKTEFGYTPRRTTAETFDLYWESKNRG